MAQGGICDGTWWFSNDSAQNLEPFQASVSSWDNYNTYLNLLECYDAGGEHLRSACQGCATYWNNLTTGNSIWNWEHMFGNGPYTPMVVLRDAIENDRIRYDGFLGAQNEFMQDRWTTIKDEQLTAFTKIIIGEVGVDEGFDNWLKTFDSMGGTRSPTMSTSGTLSLRLPRTTKITRFAAPVASAAGAAFLKSGG